MEDKKFSQNNIFTSHQKHDYMDAVRGTIVLQLPDKDVILKNILKIDLQFLAKVGVSRLHPDDVYKKKVGRATALSKMDFAAFEITSFKTLNNESCNYFSEVGEVVGFLVTAKTIIKQHRPHKNPFKSELTVRFILENNNTKIRLIKAYWEDISNIED